MKIGVARTGWIVAFLLVGLLGSGFVPTAPLDAQPYSPSNCFGTPPFACYPNGDISQAGSRDYSDLSRAYAEFAWQDFLALNFPAALDSAGNPLPIPSADNGLNYNGGNYAAVWAAYPEARDIFLPDGSAPAPFGAPHALPAACQIQQEKLGRDDVKHSISRTSKVEGVNDEVLDEYIQANRMGPVIDQNGVYLRFGIHFNQDIYDYIVDNTLYNAEGQAAFDVNDPNHNGNPVDWPRGVYADFSKQPKPDYTGSIMLKTAWKILGSGDNAANFHRIDAWVYDEAGGVSGQEPLVEEKCELRQLGLLGMHIVHRTNSSPQWVWATFEHIDNAPWIYDFGAGTPQGQFSLFSPSSCPSYSGKPACAYNQLPPHPWDPQIGTRSPTQVIRTAAPGAAALMANNNFRNILIKYAPGSVWANYFLVDVQFPTQTYPDPVVPGLRHVNPAYPDGLPTPTFLANSTLETYIQGFTAGDVTSNGNAVPVSDQMQNRTQTTPPLSVDPWSPAGVYNVSGGAQRNTSSCISCHGDAALTNGTGANFLFSMSRAASVSGK